MTDLAPLYAVRVSKDSQGECRYIPRSQALPTTTMPKLFVKWSDARKAAERYASKLHPTANVAEPTIVQVEVKVQEAAQ